MHRGIGLLAFTLAVLSIPVFDTIRVMSTRILHKRSPFSPDKTHLHHIFIDLGFSHTGTTIIILTLNLIIIAAWMLAYQLGASIDVQFYVVVVMGVLFTFVLYNFSKRQIEKNGRMLHLIQRLGKSMNFEKKGVWGTIERLIDKL
jgi:UDP-N-acetylmuramyl pentapeptide phosphotransferase/UDP-N-acetylglucosamine-1-phosphate transferase